MKKKPLRFRSASKPRSDSAIAIGRLEIGVTGWILDCEQRFHTKASIDLAVIVTEKLLWWLRREEKTYCGVDELRGFLDYYRTGHTDPEGRFGNPQLKKPVSARSLHTYHGRLKTLFRWLVKEGDFLGVNPMDSIPPPVYRKSQVQPFETHHLEALERAAKNGRYPQRDFAIICLLHDTGIRVSELCGLTWADIDMVNQRAVVHGKGNKTRTIAWGKTTKHALYAYMRTLYEDSIKMDEGLFCAIGGTGHGMTLTRSGVQQMVERLGARAGVKVVRCSPHTFRHTFAIDMLRNGENQFTVMNALGHTDTKMTANYVAFAQADVENAQRRSSPVDKRKNRRAAVKKLF